MNDHVDLAALLKRLNLATILRIFVEFEARAAAEQWTHREFLMHLLAEEVAHRAGTRVQRLARHAHFLASRLRRDSPPGRRVPSAPSRPSRSSTSPARPASAAHSSAPTSAPSSSPKDVISS